MAVSRKCPGASASPRRAGSPAREPLAPSAPRVAFCNTVSSIARADTWKVRARPRRARARVGKCVTSRPAKLTWPASGLRAPQIWAIRVDLPAPLGPITAWISPGRRSRLTSSQARTAPKDLLNPLVVRMGSVMRHPPARQKPDDATPCEEHDQKKEKAEPDMPERADSAQHMFERDEERRPRHRPVKPPDSAEDHEDHDLAAHLPGEHAGAHEAVEIGKERAREPGNRARDDKGHEAQAKGAKAHGFDPFGALARGVECKTEGRAHKAGVEPER